MIWWKSERRLSYTGADRNKDFQDTMSWTDNVRNVIPYTPGEQPKEKNIIKLNTNENPYPPSPAVAEAIRAVTEDSMRRYPDPKAEVLVSAIAEAYQIKEEQVFVGVGSDDVLAMAFLTFFNSEKPILFPDITYSFYDVWADLFRIPYETVRLQADFSVNAKDYQKENGGVILPNPNAPTGLSMPLDQIEEIVLTNRDVIVIIDEAYVDFGAESALPLIERYDNLLVVQTMSKSRSLAGMRIGYAFGSEKLIQYLNDVKFSFNSYTMNQTAIAAGAAAVRDKKYFEMTCAKIVKTREWVKDELRELGFVFPDSDSNFIFATHPDYSAKALFTRLKEQHIYVRYFEKPRIDSYLRITVGTDEQMEIFLSQLKEIMNG